MAYLRSRVTARVMELESHSTEGMLPRLTVCMMTMWVGVREQGHSLQKNQRTRQANNVANTETLMQRSRPKCRFGHDVATVRPFL